MFTSRVNSQKLCVSVNNMFTLRRTNFCSHLVDSTFIMMLSDNPSKCQQSTYIDADDIITMMLLCEPQKCRQSSHIHATNMFTFEKNFHSNEHKSHTFRQPICSHLSKFLLQFTICRWKTLYKSHFIHITFIVLVITYVCRQTGTSYCTISTRKNTRSIFYACYLHSTLQQCFIHVLVYILKAKPVYKKQ